MTTAPSHTTRPPRLWLGTLFVAILWAALLAGLLFDLASFLWFLISTGILLFTTLGFLIWWISRRNFSLCIRLTGMLAAPLLGIAVGILSKHAIQPIILLATLGIPCILAVWLAWAALNARRPAPRVSTLILALAATWSLFFLIRTSNLAGDMQADLHWRWTPTAEELYLAEQAQHPAATRPATSAPASLTLRPGDWPAFRGPDRDATVHNLKIAPDWNTHPPKVLWRQRLGPAWSSMIIVDNHLFTQEQRAASEAVTCYDALTGTELWSHTDPIRFDEGLSGPGPRATPAFEGGRLYALGATGILNGLDAATGQLLWSRNSANDSGAATPMWGFCSSPLIEGGQVFIYAGDEKNGGLLTYAAQGGPPVWKADTGKMGYSSPQSVTVAGQKLILMITAGGFYAVEEATGRVLSHLDVAQAVGVPPVAQPCRTGPDTFVLGHGAGFGTALIQLSPASPTPDRKWTSRELKPSFSDMVYYQGCIYGFDGTVFCCIDAATGARRWREGRYGTGQVILLADQGLMIVATEKGQAILLRCNPKAHEELGSIQAVSGKLWNHLALAQNHLFIRSDAEMTCLELKPQ